MSIESNRELLGEKIHETSHTAIYQTTRDSDEKSIVLKALSKKYPEAHDIARIKREYEITSKLQHIDGVIEIYSLEKYSQSNFAISMEHFGVSFADILRSGKTLSLDFFFNSAIKLVETLGEIHQSNIIHKDINPTNILCDSETGEVRIIDFGISSELSKERQDINVYQRLEGSLPYISPEQTGRMNRDLDYRSDYYSLGVTFYELLTGHTPFQANDILGWIHSHITKVPNAANLTGMNVPIPLCDIILKLLSKNAEDRYQSAYGLCYDLKKTLEQWKQKISTPFELGRFDVSHKFQIPQKLYGREKEIKVLLDVFAEVSFGQTEMILVSGYSGVGKSALVQEIQKPIVRDAGYFIEGKFDILKSSTPYSAITQAFQSLVQQLLAQPGDIIEFWKDILLRALGRNAQVLLDFIPDLEMIIGEQPPVPALSPNESQNRFHHVFLDFIKVLAQEDHPLVFFLDDLQWADIPSLNLLEKIFKTDTLSHLLCIGVYRSNEVESGHPLLQTLDEIDKVKEVNTLVIEALNEASVSQLVADSLQCTQEESYTLSALIYSKTKGNPFFIGEMLKNLFKDGSITFNNQIGKWEWDMTEINKVSISDNVISFMVESLQKMSTDVQRTLQIAACIGNQFDLKTLSTVLKCPMDVANHKLEGPLSQGLIVPLNESYKFISHTPSGSMSDINPRYAFQHDYIHQAAYALVNTGIQQVHLEIGRMLFSSTATRDLDKRKPDIVRHLNVGRSLITDDIEQEELVQLNLEVGLQAKKSNAYPSALEFAEIGLGLLFEDPWEKQYDVTLALKTLYVQCSYLMGRDEISETTITEILAHTKSNLEKAETLNIRSYQYITRGKLEKAILSGLEGLSLLETKLPYKPNKFRLMKEIVHIKLLLRKHTVPDLINNPVMSEPIPKMAIQLLSEISPAALFTGNVNLVALTTLRQVVLSLKFGNTPQSAFSYTTFGGIISFKLRNYKLGYEFGKLGLALNEQFNDIHYRCRVIATYGFFVHHYNEHWSTLTPLFQKGLEAGHLSGDYQYYARCALYGAIWNPMYSLEESCHEQEKAQEIIKNTGYPDALDGSELFLQMTRNFRGETDDRLTMNDKKFNEEECLQRMQDRKFLSGCTIYYFWKSEIYFFYEEFELALETAQKGYDIIGPLIGSPYEVRFVIQYFLCLAACYPKRSFSERAKIRKKMKLEYKKMKVWADHCPVNFLHLQLIMEAELARLTDNTELAPELYDQAIETANTNEWLRDKALANELAARYYLGIKRENVAGMYMREAYYLYSLWGAHAKLKYLEEEYSSLIAEWLQDKAIELATRAGSSRWESRTGTRFSTHGKTRTRTRTRSRLSTHSGTTTAVTNSSSTLDISEILDLETVIKASHAISGEIELEILLKKMMAIIIESSGAQSAYLMLEKDSEWLVEAEANVNTDQGTILQSIPIKDESVLISRPMINYVAHTKETIVIDNAGTDQRYAHDSYISTHKPKSVLCTPVMRQGTIIGVLYLENNATAGTFTYDRLETLKILSTQMAISIENARYYASLKEAKAELEEYSQNLERKVEERTIDLNHQSAKLQKTNAQLKRHQAMQKQWLSDISHELRTPLTILQNEIQAIEDGIIEITKESVHSLLEETERIQKIIGDLHELSLGESGALIVQKELFNPVTVLTNDIMFFRNKFSENDVEVELDLQGTEDTLIIADKVRLKQIFTNLLKNSIKYTDSPGHLKISAFIQNNSIHINFEDSHPGVNNSDLPYLFDRLYRTEEAHFGTQSGSGLGLSICKMLTDFMGGTISADHSPLGGVKFSLQFPVATMEAP
ncbi:MAG: AAA family ATPase [Fibrobacterales bacterium]